MSSEQQGQDPSKFVAVFGGNLMAPADAAIPVQDEGFLRGDGAFEVVAVQEGRPFALKEHLTRLESSARGLRISAPLDALTEDIETVVREMGVTTYALRIIVTVSGRRLVMAEPWKTPLESIRLSLVENETAPLLKGLKSLSYAANMLSTRIARERGFDEALWTTSDGRVLEAPTAAFFWVSADDRLLTPPLSDGILDSITRRVILEHLPSAEQTCLRQDIADCREAFLAGTTRCIQAIAGIDGMTPEHVSGPRTGEAAGLYRRLLAGTRACG